MTKPLVEGQQFLKLINTTNHVALDKACLTISGRGMFTAKACVMAALSQQLFRALAETHTFQNAVKEYDNANA